MIARLAFRGVLVLVIILRVPHSLKQSAVWAQRPEAFRMKPAHYAVETASTLVRLLGCL